MNEMNKHTHTHENNKNKMRYDQQHTIRNSKQRLTQWHHYHLLHREQLQPICWSLLVLGVCVCLVHFTRWHKALHYSGAHSNKQTIDREFYKGHHNNIKRNNNTKKTASTHELGPIGWATFSVYIVIFIRTISLFNSTNKQKKCWNGRPYNGTS